MQKTNFKPKRLLSLVLTLCMTLALFPAFTVPALAAGSGTFTAYQVGGSAMRQNSTGVVFYFDTPQTGLTLSDFHIDSNYYDIVNNLYHCGVKITSLTGSGTVWTLGISVPDARTLEVWWDDPYVDNKWFEFTVNGCNNSASETSVMLYQDVITGGMKWDWFNGRPSFTRDGKTGTIQFSQFAMTSSVVLLRRNDMGQWVWLYDGLSPWQPITVYADAASAPVGGMVAPAGTYCLRVYDMENKLYQHSREFTIDWPGGGETNAPVNIKAIEGVDPEGKGYGDVSTVTETSQFTGTVNWTELPYGDQGGFRPVANIILTPKTGYTFAGVPANFFTVEGAESVTNAANSNLITAVFPRNLIPLDFSVVQVGGISNLADTERLEIWFNREVYDLTRGDVTITNGTGMVVPAAGIGLYETVPTQPSRWYIDIASVEAEGNITVTLRDFGDYKITTPTKTVTVYKSGLHVTIRDIPGIVAPIPGYAPFTMPIETAQYTGTVTWQADPAMFLYGTEYTVNISLTAKDGYQFIGLTSDFFRVAGAASVYTPVVTGKTVTVTARFAGRNNDARNVVISPPVSGAVPNLSVVETPYFTGTVRWGSSPGGYDPAVFGYGVSYSFEITLTPKPGFVVAAIPANFFTTVSGTETFTSNTAGGLYIRGSFPPTGSASQVTIRDIPGITPPKTGEISWYSERYSETAQYKVSWSWAPDDLYGFKPDTIYTATITLNNPAFGYSFSGLSEDFFRVAGATSVVMLSNNGIAVGLRATFPKTDPSPPLSVPSGAPLSATIDLPFDALAGVSVEGSPLAMAEDGSGGYGLYSGGVEVGSAKPGSIVITLNKEYLTKFENGTYTLVLSLTIPESDELIDYSYDFIVNNEVHICTEDRGTVTLTATCTSEGVMTFRCVECGEVIRTEPIAKLNHKWDEGVVTVWPTCTEEGEFTFTCELCGDSFTEPIDPYNQHLYDEGVYTAPKCGVDGFWTFTCERCGYTETVTDTGTALQHKYIGVTTKEPTCTEYGVFTYTCELCGDTYTEPIEPYNQHLNRDDGVYTAPKCGIDGFWTFFCLRCNEYYTETHEGTALEHIWVKISVVEPTATTGGYTVYKCDLCGETKEDDLTPPTTASITDAEFLQARAAGILKNGLTQNNLRLTGKVLTLVIDGREFVLSRNANNRNIDGEIAIGDGWYLKFDIKGNGSNIKEFKIYKK